LQLAMPLPEAGLASNQVAIQRDTKHAGAHFRDCLPWVTF
jgi:hypothetical protein